MSGEESLPSWWTAKITKSSDYLNTARDFLLTSEGKLTENKRQIAQTILKQLGGRRFIAMTGAKNIGFTNKGLSIKICKNAKGITHVVVDYNRGKDLYDMEFVKIRGTKRTGKKVKSVYADDLKTIFKGYTGLRTSL